MKSIPFVVLFLFLFQSYAQKSSKNEANDLIKRVETGLTTAQVYVEGDATSSIEERMEHYGIPGASIAVIHNGEVVWAKGYGITDKESNAPVTPQTLFQASALSIPVSAYGALRLVEQNKVGLDENINNYLKSWKVPENEFTKEKKVTLKNLLNHSAGVYPRGTGNYGREETIPTLLEILKGTAPALNEPVVINKEPGESVRFAYASYVPVQQMMIEVEGETFPEIMNKLVLKPLEMHSSTFNQTLSKTQLDIAATGYLQDGSMVEHKSKVYPAMASYGLWTTATDYAKFVANVQQTIKGKHTKGLPKDLAELMGKPYGVSNSGWSFTCGLGFQLFNKSDEIYLRHHGWNTGFYAEIMAHRDNGYGVVVMTNSTFPAFNAEVIRAVALAYEWEGYIPTYTKMKVEPALVNRISGRYQADNRVVKVFQKDDQLFAKNIINTDGNELIRVSDSTFVTRNSNRLIQFKPSTEGKSITMNNINRNDGAVTSSLVKTNTAQKEPIEFLVDGEFEKALQGYRALREQHPRLLTVSEDYVDDLAEHFLNQGRAKLSQSTFKLNTLLYPDSFLVYDRYAEACIREGEIDLAISSFSKSLQLNPQNSRTREKLKELEKSK
ncbi:serine hydrolase [Spongiimicrobium salis]|uniref:serine hydrolase n=1 Tax=Spongiimicrobium salis TaxID=1667022 RepID=UPI00374DFA2E